MGNFLSWISLLPNLGPTLDPYPQQLANFVKKGEPKKEEPTVAKVEKDTYIRVGKDDFRKFRSLV